MPEIPSVSLLLLMKIIFQAAPFLRARKTGTVTAARLRLGDSTDEILPFSSLGRYRDRCFDFPRGIANSKVFGTAISDGRPSDPHVPFRQLRSYDGSQVVKSGGYRRAL
jgi:hypothetical protein